MAAPQEYTEAQRDAICRAYATLGEHFPASVILVEADIPSEEKNEPDDKLLYWTINGGRSNAVGMATRMIAKLVQ